MKKTTLLLWMLLMTSLSAFADIPTEGQYYLYNESSGKFLSRGGVNGVQATMDELGMPVTISTPSDGKRRFVFLDNSANLCERNDGIHTEQTSGRDFIVTEVNTGVFTLKSSYHLVITEGDSWVTVKDGVLVFSSNEEEATSWTVKTASEQQAIVAEKKLNRIINIAALGGQTVTSEAELLTYLGTLNAVDVTASIPNASLTANADNWDVELRNSDATLGWGSYTIASNGKGTVKLTQTVGKMKKGFYKVTLQAFYRGCKVAPSMEAGNAGFVLTNATLTANSNYTPIVDWYTIRDSETKPDSRGDLTDFSQEKYTNTVYTYVGDDHNLTIVIDNPGFFNSSGAWFNFNQLTITYYDDGTQQEIPDDPQEEETDTLPTEGQYYLYCETTGQFLSRGGEKGVQATMDELGMPFTLSTPVNGSRRFLFMDNSLNLYEGEDGIYTDGSSYRNFNVHQVDADTFYISSFNQHMFTEGDSWVTVKNGLMTFTDNEEEKVFWTLKTAEQQQAIVAQKKLDRIIALAAQGGQTVTSEAELLAYLGTLNAVDVTEKVPNAALTANADEWDVELRNSGASLGWGSYTIASNSKGSVKLSQTVSGMKKGFYKVTLQAFYRGCKVGPSMEAGNAGFVMTNATLAANSNYTPIVDWYTIRDSETKPDSRGDLTDFTQEKYTNTVYTYVGDDGELTIVIDNPAYFNSSGAWFNFNELTVTYYDASEEEPEEPEEWETIPTEGQYYLYCETTGQFLSRGGVKGVQATMDELGVPFTLSTPLVRSRRFLFMDNSLNLYEGEDGLYTDGSSYRNFNVVEVSEGQFVITSYNKRMFTEEDSWATVKNGLMTFTNNEEEKVVWSFKTAEEQQAIVAQKKLDRIIALAAQGGQTVTSEAELLDYLGTLEAKDVTMKVPNAALDASSDYWTVELRNSSASFSWGKYTIASNNGGSVKLSQTVSKMKKGFYKITLQAFYRGCKVTPSMEAGNAGFVLSNATLAANSNYTPIVDWYTIRDSETKPDSRGDIADFTQEKYTNTVYTYVGDDKKLTIIIDNPSYFNSSGAWFNFNHMTVTYYDDGTQEDEPEEPEELVPGKDLTMLVTSSACNSLTGWNITSGSNGAFEVNTWSSSGGKDGSGLTTPFIQNFVESPARLNNATITHDPVTGLTPGFYRISAHVRLCSEAGVETISGGTMFANDVTLDLTRGHYYKYSGKTGIYSYYSIIAEVKEDSTLTFGFDVQNATHNWIAFKNVKLTYIGETFDRSTADMTIALVNPSFETTSTPGWGYQAIGSSGIKTADATYGASGVDGDALFYTWDTSNTTTGDFFVEQVIGGIPEGSYQVGVRYGSDEGYSAELYGNSFSVPINAQNASTLTPATASFLVTDGVAVIGLRSSNWFKADAFTLIPQEMEKVDVKLEALAQGSDGKFYGTFITPFRMTCPEGIKAYSCNEVQGDKVVLKELKDNIIPLNTPVVVVSNTSYSEVFNGEDISNGAEKVKNGYLTGVYKDTSLASGSNCYVLSTSENGAIFKLVTDDTQVDKNNCYIIIPAAIETTELKITDTTYPDLSAAKSELLTLIEQYKNYNTTGDVDYENTMNDIYTQTIVASSQDELTTLQESVEVCFAEYISKAEPIDKPIDLTMILKNADLSKNSVGWSITIDNPTGQTKSYKFYSDNNPHVFEAYSGASTYELSGFSMLQKVTLSEGMYRLKVQAFYRYGLTYNTDLQNLGKAVSYANLVVGMKRSQIMRLGDIPLSTYPNTLAEASTAFRQGLYWNELVFTVDKTQSVVLGVRGTHPVYQSWFASGPFVLEKISESVLAAEELARFNAEKEQYLAYWEEYKDIAAQATEHEAFDTTLLEAENIIGDIATQEQLDSLDAVVKNAVAELITSTPSVSGQYDITSLIRNHDFNNGYEGWNRDGNVFWNTPGVMEVYGKGKATLSQTMTNMPAGTYVVKAQAFQRTNTNTVSTRSYEQGTEEISASLNFGGQSQTICSIHDGARYLPFSRSNSVMGAYNKSIPNNISGASAAFNGGEYWNQMVVECTQKSDLDISITVDGANANNWTAFDNFRLYYGNQDCNIALSDDAAFNVKEDTYANVTTNIELSADKLNSVCLPFDMNASDFSEAYVLAGVEFSQSTGAVGTLVPVDGTLEAGNMYFVKVAQPTTISAQKVLVKVAKPDSTLVYWENAATTGFYSPRNVKDAYVLDDDGTLKNISTSEVKPAYRGIIRIDNEIAENAKTITLKVANLKSLNITVNLENVQIRKYLAETKYTSSSDASKVSSYNTPNPPARLDQPHTVLVPLPSHSDGTTLTYSERSTFANGTTLSVRSVWNTCEVANLIPGKTYYFKAEDEGKVIAQGLINTQGQLRMIKANTGNNIRDLGGWPTADGKTVKYGLLYRGGEMNGDHPIDEYDRLLLRGLGINAELDIREDVDITAYTINSSALGRDVPYIYMNQHGHSSTTVATDSVTLGSAFRWMLNNLRKGNPVYFHCYWGADRTAMYAMLYLGVLGVEKDEQYKDYELTTFSNAGLREKSGIDSKLEYIESLEGDTYQEKCYYYWTQVVGISNEDVDEFIRIMTDENYEVTINDPSIEEQQIITPANGNIYDLQGRKVDNPSRGIYIINGKKVLVK